MWRTAVHVGVDRAQHSRRVLLPDSFLCSSSTTSTTPTLSIHAVNPTPPTNTPTTPPPPQPPQYTHTHTHKQTSTHFSLCKLRQQTRLSAAVAVSHANVFIHPQQLEESCSQSPMSLWAANGCSPVSPHSHLLFFYNMPTLPSVLP